MADRLIRLASSLVVAGGVVLSMNSILAVSASAQGAGVPSAESGSTPGGRSAPEPSVGDQAADLEGRLIDLQVQLATRRSLMGAVKDPQSMTIENEIQTISRQFSTLSGRPASIRAGATDALAPGTANRTTGAPGGTQPPPNFSANDGNAGAAPGWGATTVTRGDANQGGADPGELRRDQVLGPQGDNQSGRQTAAWGRPIAPAPFVPSPSRPASVQGPEEEYQTAYSYLLQQDYGAAETAFREFLSRHSSSALAGNAQYWLGETHYVRGAYREAAVAFLKGFEKYGDGSKGADSLLKLGLSLARLNQKSAACSSLTEVKRRYASAPRALLDRAGREARRLSCPK